MKMNPKQLLQVIHNRGEQAHVAAIIHDQAREAAQELAKWIDEQLALNARRAEAEKIASQNQSGPQSTQSADTEGTERDPKKGKKG